MLKDHRWNEVRAPLVLSKTRRLPRMFKGFLKVYGWCSCTSHLFTHHANQTVAMYARLAISVFRAILNFQSCYFSVLHPILLKLHISALLDQSYHTVYRWCLILFSFFFFIFFLITSHLFWLVTNCSHLFTPLPICPHLFRPQWLSTLFAQWQFFI